MAELNWRSLSLAVGTLKGLCLLLMGLFAASGVSFLWFSPEVFSLLKSVYPGFNGSVQGAVIGFAWGFFDGALFGAILAGLYNWASRFKPNLPKANRIARVIVGLLLLYFGSYWSFLYVLAAISFVEALIGYCALFAVFGKKKAWW